MVQPPSGGCVLKHDYILLPEVFAEPAAFGRLCVETKFPSRPRLQAVQPPSGGCVLKPRRGISPDTLRAQPPSGGCVLKPDLPCCVAKRP